MAGEAYLPYDEDFQVYALTMQDNSDMINNIYSSCGGVASTGRKLTLPDENVARIFHRSPQIATRTRQVTTQKGIQSMTEHLCRHFDTKHDAVR
jgi:hypothetical protein